MPRERDPKPGDALRTLPTGSSLPAREDTPSALEIAETLANAPHPHSASIESAETLPLPSHAPTHPPLAVGDVLGDRYQILQELGRGAEAVVFRVIDLRAETVVALKLFQQAEGSAAFLGRFRRELAMARKVTHPGVVRIHDLVLLPDKLALSMELVEGVSLDARLRDHRPLSVLELTALARDLAQALAAAHEAGVTHRDLKPANVMLRAANGRAVITDFGVSRLHGATATAPASALTDGGHVRLTQDGALIGTPQYMAPEQLDGHADVGPTADIYAFGLVLFEAATGQRPHEATTLFELRERRHTMPVPSLGVLRPELPQRLSDAVDRCLLADPLHRFAAGRDLLAELETPGEGSQDADSSPGSTALSPDLPRRSYGPLALALAALAFAGAWSIYRPRPPTQPPASASAPTTMANVPWARALRPQNVRRLPSTSPCSEFPSFTPDDRRIVYDATVGPDCFVMVRDIESGESHAITHVRGWDYAPAVSPDGQSVAFLRTESGKIGTYVVDIEGASEPELVARGNVRPHFSLDGESIWAGDRDAPGQYSRTDHALLRTLTVAPGLVATHFVDLDDGRVIGLFPKTRNATSGGIGLYEPDGSMAWLYQGNVGRALVVTPDRTHVMAIEGEDPAYDLIAVPLDRSPIFSMKGTGIVPRSGGMSVTQDGRSVVWSKCGGSDSLAILGADGTLTDARGGAQDLDATPVPGGHEILVITREDSGARVLEIDRDGSSPPISLPLGITATALVVSPDGTTLAGILDHKGVFLMPLAPEGTPTWLTHASTDGSPSFRANGQEVIFGRDLPEGDSQILAVSVGGGRARLLVPTEGTIPVASPVDDRIVYLQGRVVSACLPMILDLRTGAKRLLSKKLARGTFGRPAFSPDGRRVVLERGGNEIVEIDVVTGDILREVDTGASSVFRLFYSGTDILAVRTQWIGDLWMADAAPVEMTERR